MCAAALELARGEHDLERVADLYVRALEETAGAPAARSAVISEISVAAVEVGLDVDGEELRDVALRMKEVGLA
jgi:hypothetical protein